MEGYAEASKVDYFQIRRDFIKRIVDEHEWDKRSGSQTFRSTLDTLALSAGEYARAHDLSACEYEELLGQCFDIVWDYSWALNSAAYGGENSPLRGWYHRRSITQDIISGNIPDIDHDTVAELVSKYLALPFRNQSIERVLIDLLMAQEIYAFGREVRPQLHLNTFTGFMKNRLFNAIGWAVLAWVIYAVFDKDWTVPIFWIFVAQSVLALVLAMRPSKPGKLLSTMNAAYCELNGGGPFSGKHIESRVKAANEGGVIWPASLYVCSMTSMCEAVGSDCESEAHQEHQGEGPPAGVQRLPPLQALLRQLRQRPIFHGFPHLLFPQCLMLEGM